MAVNLAQQDECERIQTEGFAYQSGRSSGRERCPQRAIAFEWVDGKGLGQRIRYDSICQQLPKPGFTDGRAGNEPLR